MDPNAIERAKDKLRRAEKALANLKAAENYQDAEDAWGDFLLAANSIYSKIGEGAKGNGKSQAWFGRKRNERRTTDVLRYIRYARNSDEHGIERITQEYVGSSFPNTKLKFGERRNATFKVVDASTGLPHGRDQQALIFGASIVCVRAYDRRFGDYCDPPRMTGNLWRANMVPKAHDLLASSEFPDLIAEAALPYLAAMIEEAEALV